MMKKQSLMLLLLFALALMVLPGMALAAEGDITDFAGLKAAIAGGQSSIVVDGEIILTEKLTVSGNITISGSEDAL